MSSLQDFFQQALRRVYVSYRRARALEGRNDEVLLLGQGEAAHKAAIWQNPSVRQAKAGAKVHCLNLGIAKVVIVEESPLLLDG